MGDGALLNQFLSQALGLVGGAGEAPAAPPTAAALVQADHRRFADMTAVCWGAAALGHYTCARAHTHSHTPPPHTRSGQFGDFGDGYLATLSEVADHYRMRADEQQTHLQERQRLLQQRASLSAEQVAVLTRAFPACAQAQAPQAPPFFFSLFSRRAANARRQND